MTRTMGGGHSKSPTPARTLPPPPPADPAVLIDDLVEEFLLRLPPEDPAGLARAALVSRQWHRVITGPAFRRRFREFHRSAPLLGFILSLAGSIRFVPTSSFRPPHADRRDVRVVHSGHGRVLLHRSAREDTRVLLFGVLSVWDPVTDELRELPSPPVTPGRPLRCNWDAAVVCATAVGDEGCNHLHCHFKVVFVGRSGERAFSCFYSSESDSWNDPIFASLGGHGYAALSGNCVLAGSALYFRGKGFSEIFKYDMVTHQMCTISVPGDVVGRGSPRGLLIVAEDGRIGIAKASSSTLHLFLRDQSGTWAESRVIQLHTLLPDDALPDPHPQLPCEACTGKPSVVGFAEIGAGVILLRTHVGVFNVDLNSGTSKKVGEVLPLRGRTVPYVGFCTPALGAVSTHEGPGAGAHIFADEVLVDGVAVSNDEGPGAGVAISADEGSGAGVGVSTDEGPGDGVCQVHKKLKLQVQGLLNQEGKY